MDIQTEYHIILIKLLIFVLPELLKSVMKVQIAARYISRMKMGREIYGDRRTGLPL